jgi:hypothetical protein
LVTHTLGASSVIGWIVSSILIQHPHGILFIYRPEKWEHAQEKGVSANSVSLDALLHRVPPARPTPTIQEFTSDCAAPSIGSVVWFSIHVTQYMLL